MPQPSPYPGTTGLRLLSSRRLRIWPGRHSCPSATPSSYQREAWSPPGCRYSPGCCGSTLTPDVQNMIQHVKHIINCSYWIFSVNKWFLTPATNSSNTLIYRYTQVLVITVKKGGCYRLSDIEDFPPLCVQGHQPGGDEVSSPWLHSAVQHLIQIHLDSHNIEMSVH